TGVPVGGTISAFAVSEFALEERISHRTVEFLPVDKLARELHTVGTSIAGGDDLLVTYLPIFGTLAGDAHAVSNREGVVSILLVEPFQVEAGDVGGTKLKAGDRLVGEDMFQLLVLVDEVAIRILVTQGGVGRPHGVASHVAVEVPLVIQSVGGG